MRLREDTHIDAIDRVEEPIMTQVIVQLVPSPTSETEAQEHAAFKQAKEFGASLQAIHPTSDDPGLASWFSAQVDNTRAAEFVETLRRMPEVTAAYVKPRAAMP
jgi:hypothetical protein